MAEEKRTYEEALDSAVGNAMDTAYENREDEHAWQKYLRANIWDQIETHGLDEKKFFAYARKHAGVSF